MREAFFYEKGQEHVECFLCPHKCRIREGARGLCQVRENKDNTLYSLAYGNLVGAYPDPIEKKPLFHFLPGSKSFSIACPGCNFRCDFCQNWRISQAAGTPPSHKPVDPKKVVEDAKAGGCRSIAYTYTEPTIYLEYALDVMRVAKQEGLANVFVTNGYTSPKAREAVTPYLDAANVDLKSMSDEFYKKLCAGTLEPVLESIRDYRQKGVWIELTTLLIPDINDSKQEITQIASFIKDVDPEIPWHISRFHPDYKRDGGLPTSIEKIKNAVAIGKKVGVKHIYPGNLSHRGVENTHCPKCTELLIERQYFTVKRNNLQNGFCPQCQTEIKGVW